MKEKPAIEFVLRDRVDGEEITPSTIGLSRFNEFNQQVQDFLAGSQKLNVEKVHLLIEAGSYRLIAFLPPEVQTAIEPDLERLHQEDALAEIDPRRAEVIGKWQARAKSSEQLRYVIQPVGFSTGTVELSRATDYRMGNIVPWVRVEKYLFGQIMDMGGVQKANVHIRLEGTGQVVKVGSNQGYLKEQTQNRLYRKALIRVEADQHYKTKELRNLRLISFENYRQGYDEAALDAFAAAGTEAWADVPDAAAWVREIRGGYG